MGAPLGIGQAFGNVIRGERDNRDFYSAADGAAKMFESLGSENAKQYAQMLRSDPRAAFAMAQQVGGMKSLIAMEQANSARERIATATAGQEVGSREWVGSLANASAQEGELGSAAQFAQLMRPTASEKPIIREFKVGDRIETRQFDPATKQWTKLDEGPRFAPQQGEEITVGPDGTVIRRGTFAQQAAEAAGAADESKLFDAIDDLQDLTKASGGTVGIPAQAGRIGGAIGHVGEQYGVLPQGSAEGFTQAASGGASQDELAESASLVQTVTIGSRAWLADKGNLNRDERRDLRVATGADALTPQNRIRSLMTIRALGLSREIRRRRGIGQPHPLDPQVNPSAFISSMRERGYSDEEIEKLDDRLTK